MITEAELLRRRQPPSPTDGHPIWAMGFRPFFLLAGLAAVVLVPWWVAGLTGHLPLGGGLGGVLWHAHEMVLGFALAVVAGFLLTAVPKWTSTEPLQGAPLKGLALLWVAGRVGMAAAPWLPAPLVAALDLGFLPGLAFAIGRPIFKTRNRRNLLFPLLLCAMGLLNLLYHLQAMGLVQGGAQIALRAALDGVVVMMTLVGGRVIPMFTRNGLAAVGVQLEPRPAGHLDTIALVAVVALVPVELLGAPRLLGALCLVAGALVLARLYGWGGALTARVPLLWVLHLGYAWIGAGLLLRGLALVWPGSVQETAALHALTAGAMATLILGMMSRVALGHTGRPLAAPAPVAVSFVLLTLCALVRVSGPVFMPDHYVSALTVAAALWAAAFGIFVVFYLPILTSRRPDQRPG